MAEEPNKITENSRPEAAASKPVRWFMLAVLLVACAGYFAGERIERTFGRHWNGLGGAATTEQKHLSHSQSGDEAFAKKHYDQAVSEYRLALKDQDSGEAHEHLGEALLKQGNPEAAFAEFQASLRLDAACVNAASAWGQALAAEGKPEEAARVLQDALQRNAESGLLHYNLATTLLQMQINAEGRRRMAVAAGQTEVAQSAETEVKGLATNALRHFATASRNKFDSPAFWGDYGQLLNQMGKYPEAEGCLVRSVAEDASVAAAHFQLALAEDHLGQYAEAIEHYEKVLQLTPNDPDTLNALALLYASATNAEVRTPKMAVQLATRACDATTDQNARYMDTLARSCAADGDFFQAITWEDKAIRRATQLGDKDLARELQEREELFMDHKTE